MQLLANDPENAASIACFMTSGIEDGSKPEHRIWLYPVAN